MKYAKLKYIKLKVEKDVDKQEKKNTVAEGLDD